MTCIAHERLGHFWCDVELPDEHTAFSAVHPEGGLGVTAILTPDQAEVIVCSRPEVTKLYPREESEDIAFNFVNRLVHEPKHMAENADPSSVAFAVYVLAVPSDEPSQMDAADALIQGGRVVVMCDGTQSFGAVLGRQAPNWADVLYHSPWSELAHSNDDGRPH